MLLGDATRARRDLGWAPKVSFDELVRMMVAHDYKRERRKMIQVTESKLVDDVWHRIAGGSETVVDDPAQPAQAD